ncbi:hypothetical protein M758_12G158400 [Ceratodon purpureus]|nr:hypothetical protein M758_12G158400 [Ceratodon purpureus]
MAGWFTSFHHSSSSLLHRKYPCLQPWPSVLSEPAPHLSSSEDWQGPSAANHEEYHVSHESMSGQCTQILPC